MCVSPSFMCLLRACALIALYTLQITDHIQIRSGSHLAVFDPCHWLEEHAGGVRIDVIDCGDKYADQLSAFGALVDESKKNSWFDGTVLRLPLRNRTGSPLSDKLVQPAEIKELLMEFVRDEMAAVLLFLSNVKTIEVREADGDSERLLAEVHVEEDAHEQITAYGDVPHTSTACSRTITVTQFVGSGHEQRGSRCWRVVRANFAPGEIDRRFSERLGFDAAPVVKREKLLPQIALAAPVAQEGSFDDGRLFTYLPLPIPTGFPLHIQGLFALTQDRQHLRNPNEKSLQDNDL
jgi:hypothetical protein